MSRRWRAAWRMLAAALMALGVQLRPAQAAPACAFEAAPRVLFQDGEAGRPGSRLLQVWETPDRAVLWSALEPEGYAAFRAAALRQGADPDPLRALAAAPSRNNAIVAASAGAWIRPARCLQMLLQQAQHRRIDVSETPTEFAAFVLRSPDGRRLRVYFYTANLDGIGRMSPISDQVEADRAAGWTVVAGLHNHAFHLGGPAELNGVLAPSLPDAQFNSRFAARAGMQQAWITNGLHTVEIPAAALDGFEGADALAR